MQINTQKTPEQTALGSQVSQIFFINLSIELAYHHAMRQIRGESQ